ncbi:MAG: TlyA family RNA methyltransferase [Verrucomicrobia bacterium]|nr:TlyA family RNA methyltransferase [Verrucomicrobiota bacterium]
MEKLRLDLLLVERGLCESREKAKRAIMAGQVLVAGQVTDKPSTEVATDAAIELKAEEKFVSRGGHKLEAALDHFKIRVTGAVCADLGASTGGFTDCLLQRGAARIHAVDVGKGQLAYKLRRDPRVVVHDGVNARHLQRQQIGEPADIVTMDLAFIGLAKVLPAAKELLKPAGDKAGGGVSTTCDTGVIIALIKPQFEAGPKDVGKGGVVKDPAVHKRVVEAVRTFATKELGLRCDGVIESPLLGPAGNKEFLICLRR